MGLMSASLMFGGPPQMVSSQQKVFYEQLLGLKEDYEILSIWLVG